VAEQVLSREKLITPSPASDGSWYRGRPVMVTRNDYNIGLFNGDIGITMFDPQSAEDRLKVFFPGGGDGGPRLFACYRLPEHETVYALTVHKSQGSEFDHVVIVLPDKDYPLLSRELIYTALTRARKTVSIWGTEAVFKSAVKRKIERTSGLRDTLWE
jgi:exodeoxyribonuclease V alpha subunit